MSISKIGAQSLYTQTRACLKIREQLTLKRSFIQSGANLKVLTEFMKNVNVRVYQCIEQKI